MVLPADGDDTAQRGQDGRWSYTGGTHPYASPEGAALRLSRS
ncbi:hypothetical protein ACF09H_22110 [Streptomyces sp. NPDC014983]